MAGRKLAKEEVEQIDELSKNTLKSYTTKAIDSTRTMPGTGSKDEGSKKSKRLSSVMLAAKKLNKEDVDQIDELSKGTLTRYAGAAADDLSHVAFNKGKAAERLKYDPDALNYRLNKLQKSYDKRRSGLDLALKKLAKNKG